MLVLTVLFFCVCLLVLVTEEDVVSEHCKGDGCAYGFFWSPSCVDVFIACDDILLATKLGRILAEHEKAGKARIVKDASLADFIFSDRFDRRVCRDMSNNRRTYYLFVDEKPSEPLPLNVTIYNKGLFLKEKTIFKEFGYSSVCL